MAEDRIVKFCARVGPRSISLVMTNCLPDRRGQGHVLIFLANKCWYLENDARYSYTYNGRLIGNGMWPIKWQQRQWPWMTFKVIHRLQAFPNAIHWTFVQHFTPFQLTVCSHGSSALAELLVSNYLPALSISFMRFGKHSRLLDFLLFRGRNK